MHRSGKFLWLTQRVRSNGPVGIGLRDAARAARWCRTNSALFKHHCYSFHWRQMNARSNFKFTMSKSVVKRFSTSGQLACLQLSRAGHNWPKAWSIISSAMKKGRDKWKEKQTKEV